MPQTLSNLLTHFVFSTRNRQPTIDEATLPILHAYIGGIVKGEGGVAIAVGGICDHVHILARRPPRLCEADLMRIVKATSSKWMNEEHRPGFRWQGGYAAFSVSHSNADDVRHYVSTQPERHARMTFREELLALLKRHHVEYDERYMWD